LHGSDLRFWILDDGKKAVREKLGKSISDRKNLILDNNGKKESGSSLILLTMHPRKKRTQRKTQLSSSIFNQ
jgi:hypothetical protein